MDKVRVIEVKQSVFADNDARADRLRRALKAQQTFLVNLMSSPGAGKTTTLKRTIADLKNELRIGVMEADIDSTVDAEAIAATGAKAIQLHTGGMCHLDAAMTEQGLREIGAADCDLVVLENVGNLVCPAEFDTGASRNVAILSVPEGHDKPLKYPLMFEVCQALIVNKIDVLPYFDFDLDKLERYAHMRNPDLAIFPVSAKTGEGFPAWEAWLRDQTRGCFFMVEARLYRLAHFISPANGKLPYTHNIYLTWIPFIPQCGKHLKFLKTKGKIKLICSVIFFIFSHLDCLDLDKGISLFHCCFPGASE